MLSMVSAHSAQASTPGHRRIRASPTAVVTATPLAAPGSLWYRRGHPMPSPHAARFPYRHPASSIMRQSGRLPSRQRYERRHPAATRACSVLAGPDDEAGPGGPEPRPCARAHQAAVAVGGSLLPRGPNRLGGLEAEALGADAEGAADDAHDLLPLDDQD